MSTFKFKEGDTVILSSIKCNSRTLRGFSSSGTLDEAYKITMRKKSFGKIVYRLEGSNWHKEEWLSLRHSEAIIGGEIL